MGTCERAPFNSEPEVYARQISAAMLTKWCTNVWLVGEESLHMDPVKRYLIWWSLLLVPLGVWGHHQSLSPWMIVKTRGTELNWPKGNWMELPLPPPAAEGRPCFNVLLYHWSPQHEGLTTGIMGWLDGGMDGWMVKERGGEPDHSAAEQAFQWWDDLFKEPGV